MRQANAVDARQALDLRIGAAFTRMQTLALQARFAQLFEGKVVSYGPCQFPTLGFVVTRYEQVQSFVSERFWYIYLALSRPGEDEEERLNVFSWKRGNLFDYDVAYMLYEMVLERPQACVPKSRTRTSKNGTSNSYRRIMGYAQYSPRKPLPLTTVELQKTGSRMLKMTPKQILDVSYIHLSRATSSLILYSDRRKPLPTGDPLLPPHRDGPV
jgi:DNA topoisomerase-3